MQPLGSNWWSNWEHPSEEPGRFSFQRPHQAALASSSKSGRASQVAQSVKNLPAIQETWVQSQGREVPLEWQPTPVFLPGKSHGQRNLVGYSLKLETFKIEEPSL